MNTLMLVHGGTARTVILMYAQHKRHFRTVQKWNNECRNGNADFTSINLGLGGLMPGNAAPWLHMHSGESIRVNS